VVRYMHYSFMVFGHNRIPLSAGWLGQADESRMHAIKAGEHVTTLGGHPSLKIGQLLETLSARRRGDSSGILRTRASGTGRIPQAAESGSR